MNSSQSTHAYKHLLRHTLRLSRHHCYVNETRAYAVYETRAHAVYETRAHAVYETRVHAVYDNSNQVPWVCGECAVGSASSSLFI